MSKNFKKNKKLRKHFIDDEAEVEDSNGDSIASDSMEPESSLDRDLSDFVVPDEEDEEEEEIKDTKGMYLQSLKEKNIDEISEFKEMVTGKIKPKTFKSNISEIKASKDKASESGNNKKDNVLKKKHERDNSDNNKKKDVIKQNNETKKYDTIDTFGLQRSIFGYLKPKVKEQQTMGIKETNNKEKKDNNKKTTPAETNNNNNNNNMKKTTPAETKKNNNMKKTTPAETNNNNNMKKTTPAETNNNNNIEKTNPAENENQMTLPTISFPSNMNISPHQKALFNEQLQKLFTQLLKNQLVEEKKKEPICVSQNVVQMEIHSNIKNELKNTPVIKQENMEIDMEKELKHDIENDIDKVVDEIMEVNEDKTGEIKEKKQEDQNKKFTFVPFVVRKNKIDDTEIKQLKKKALQGKRLNKEEAIKLRKYNKGPKYEINLIEKKEDEELKQQELQTVDQMKKISAGLSQTDIDNQLEMLRTLIEKHGDEEEKLELIMKDVEYQKLLQLDLKSNEPVMVQIKNKPIKIRKNNETYFLMTFKDEIAFAKPGHKGSFVKTDGTELGGMETIEAGTSKNFRLQSMSFFLTYPRCPISTLGTFRRTFLAMIKSRGYEISHLLICREYHSAENIKEAAVNEALSSIGPKAKLEKLVPLLSKQVRYVDFDKKYKEEFEKGVGYDARGDVHYHVMLTLTERKFIRNPHAFDLTLKTTGEYDEKDEFYPIFEYPIKGKNGIHGNYQHMHDPESSRHYLLKTLYAYNEQHKGVDPEQKVKDWFFYEMGNLVAAEQMKKHTTAMLNKKIYEKSNKNLVFDGDIHINTLPLVAKAKQLLSTEIAEIYAAEFAKDQIYKRQNIWMCGMSGGGKSTLARRHFSKPEDNPYIFTGEIHWWDGFVPGVNKKIIVDDLLQTPGVLGKIKEYTSELMGKVPVKGGHTKPAYDSLIITANWFPWDLPNADLHNDIYPICRKIRMISVYPKHFCVPYDTPLPADFRRALQPVITQIALFLHEGDLIVQLIDKERLYMPYPDEYRWLNMAAHLFKAYKVAMTGLWLNNKMPIDEVIGETDAFDHETGLLFYYESEKKTYPVYRVHYCKELGILYHPRIKINESDLYGLMDTNFKMLEPKIYVRPDCIMPADEARKKCPVEVPVITRTVKEITKKNETYFE